MGERPKRQPGQSLISGSSMPANGVTSVNALISKPLGTHLYTKVFFHGVVELSLNYRVFVKYLAQYLSIINTGYQPRK